MHRTELLDRLAATGSVPLGHLTEQEAAGIDARGAMPATAARGLIDRGLLAVPDSTGPAGSSVAPGGAGSLRARDELDVILGIRRAPAAVVYVGQQAFRAVLHGFREVRLTGSAPGISGFLEERVDRAGLHHFTVRTTANAVDALAARADPDGAAPRRPGPEASAAPEVPPDAWRAVLELGPGVTRLDAYHSRPGGTRRIQLSVLVRAGHAAAAWTASGVEPEEPRLLAVTADGLRRVLRDAVCDPGGDPPGGQTTATEDRMTGVEGPPFRCPVCGYVGLDEPPRTDDSGPSYEICPSCGFEFGVSDDDRGYSYAAWRQEWIDNGMRWWSRAHRKPPGWDAPVQLLALLESGQGDAAGG